MITFDKQWLFSHRPGIILGISALVILMFVGLLFHKRTPASKIIRAQKSIVSETLADLSQVSEEDAGYALSTSARRFALARSRIINLRAQDDLTLFPIEESNPLDILYEDIDRLVYQVEQWQDRLSDASAEVISHEWRLIVIDILRERARWPHVTTPGYVPPLLARRTARQGIQRGLLIGAFWPVRAVINQFRLANSSRYGPIRRSLFPFNQRSNFRSSHISGFAVGSIGVGFFLCWLGVREPYAWFSYAGLLYFVYAIIFGLCLLCLHVGILV